MTPGARVAAAIEILGDMQEGLAAEQALTRWARRSRFAGSKDRAAIRDYVFDVLRRKRTASHYGGGQSPRALMLGALREQGADLDALFSGEGHAPVPLSQSEQQIPAPPQDRATRMNLPDWLVPLFDDSLGADADRAAQALQERAPIFVRANIAHVTAAEAQAKLTEEGISTTFVPECGTALRVTDGARKLRNSEAYQSGLIELQDAASQALVAALPPGHRVLDYCAGGGGKALAVAAQPNRTVSAHDIDPARMRDLPVRAARAGTQINILVQEQMTEPFDLVLCDAPCSGSGAWRRAAEGKWTLTPERLAALTEIQDDILRKAAALVKPRGTLAYATCSILNAENEDRVTAFLAEHQGWRLVSQHRFPIGDAGDGFFAAHLQRD